VTWSPDSQFITYSKFLPNQYHGVFVYSLADKKAHQLTDGRSDCLSPRFDRSGKYLWFVASTNLGPALGGGGDMSAMGRATSNTPYGIVLRKDQSSPFGSESDEENAGSGSAVKPADKTTVRIDYEGIDQRIVAVPVPRANYVQLEVADGTLFLMSGAIVETDEDSAELSGHDPVQVQRFDLKTRKLDRFIDKMDPFDRDDSDRSAFELSADGSKALFSAGGAWFVVDSAKAPGVGEGVLKLDDLQVWVDPRAEWKQMFHEVWRIERDFLYDPKAHGMDLAQAEKVYAPFVPGLGGREGLNDLFVEMLGNLVLGHVFVGGGAMPPQLGNENDGLLGADLGIEGKHYKIARILKGENWNPRLFAPLTQPGVVVKEGDFILAVNGEEVSANEPFDRYMLGTANKRTVLTLASTGDGRDKHDVTIVPQPSEGMLRFREWIEHNKRRVDQLSNGKLAYVYVPDTQSDGFLYFNRYFYAQTDKQGVIVDERFNHGGFIADYVIRALQAQVVMGISSRDNTDLVDPIAHIPGPRVMIANQMSGSGGDALPWLFKRAKLGPLVGKRTWGGLVGIGDYPRLIDGGGVTAPRGGLYSAEGKWEIENLGVAPDVEVEQDPELVRQGHDPQLEKAVQLALEALGKSPVVLPKRPAFPDYGPRLPKP
jgi:tricorn protease